MPEDPPLTSAPVTEPAPPGERLKPTPLVYALVVLSGASVGYLLGLSQADVIQASIATLLAAVVAVAAAFGRDEGSGYVGKVMAVVFTCLLLVGMPWGASLGIYIRDHGKLTPQDKPPIVSKEKGEETKDQGDKTAPPIKPSVLHDLITDKDSRERIAQAKGVDLVNALEETHIPLLSKLAAPFHSKQSFTKEELEQLEAIRQVALGPKQEP